MKRVALIVEMFVLALLAVPLCAEDWKPVPGHIMTPWAAKVDPKNPWPEYPRPQLVRKQWVNLNGLWDYAIESAAKTPDAAGQKKDASAVGSPTWKGAYEGKILVPFPIESALSGVRRPLLPDQRLHYRRTFTAPDLSGGKRLLLNFEAVDWEAKVSVNGKAVGEHRGGYDRFTLDITDAVKPGGQNELLVSVFDATGGYQPKGKQNLRSMTDPGGIMYTPCSGIWQTVWLEAVPAARIDDLKITPDVDAGVLRLKVAASGAAQAATVEAVALEGDREVARATGKPGAKLALPIKGARLWSPDDPFLYGLKVTLKQGKQALDTVDSYFGMRKIALGKDDKDITRILLNGKFVFQAGPLDQGFWPDGIYTAPTDEALRFDIEAMKKFGFNMARKHVKIEPERWYYWCDKLGLLVWQDMPSGGAGRGAGKDKDGEPVSAEAGLQFQAELQALVEQHAKHPAIIMWIVFNEGWGQHDTPRLTQWVKQLDPSRLVSNTSGWQDRQCGDIVDVHSYPGPACPKAEAARAAVLGEFGGLGLPVPDHLWTDKSWGYRGMATPKALTRKYVDLWRKAWELKDDPGLCAAVYTQLTDCETECNGLLTYDRKVEKVDAKQAADAHHGKFAPPPQYETVAPTAQHEPITWRYTTQKPADDWFKPGFDDKAWKEGPAGFGMGNPKNAAVRTRWNSDDIWLRRQVTLPEGKLRNPMLKVFHDDDVEIYVNGVLAAKATGFNTDYEEFDLAPEAASALRPGANLIAVHCHQVKGGQYIDVGLVQQQ